MDELIDYGGRLLKWTDLDVTPQTLLGADYAYQRIHVFEGKPLFMDEHVQILEKACHVMYGVRGDLEPFLLRGRIEALLRTNGYVRGSQSVMLRLFPEGLMGEPDPMCLLEVERTLLYPRFVVWHTRPIVEVVPYSHTDEGFASSVSLAATDRARMAARQKGADEAVIENDHGVLVSIDDEPLFVVHGQTVSTSPLASGATDSVMRRAGVAAVQRLQLSLREVPVMCGALETCDEAFTLSVQGVVSIMRCGGRRFFNMTALKLVEELNRSHF